MMLKGGEGSPTDNAAEERKESDQSTEPVARATFTHVYLLALAMKLGGCTIAWSYGLEAGFWEFFIAAVGLGVAYILFGLCMAEMFSILTFSGGYYGYARVILGPLGGYLVGCSGLLESIFYFGMNVLKISEFVWVCFDLNPALAPVIWVFIYFILLVLVIACSFNFWEITSFYTISMLIILMIYLFGSMPHLDFDKYALPNNSSGFESDPDLFLEQFRLCILFFIGFDLLTLTASEVSDAKKTIPKALIAGIVTVLVLAMWIMFTVSSQSPGITPKLYNNTTFFPLVFGYMRLFNISYKHATALGAIPIIGSTFMYLYIIAKQVKSMATSALLPTFFSKSITIGNQSIPIIAYIVVCIAGFAANYFALYINIYRTSSRVASMAGCVVYLAMMYCYVQFASRYSHMERSFKNPFGVYSAIISSIIFLAVLVILIAFHTEYIGVTILYFSYMAVMLLYYYVHVETNQKFSSMEQKVFFKAYILNFNKRKKKSFLQKMNDDLRRNLSWLLHRCCSASMLARCPFQDEDSPSTSVKSNSRYLERSASRSRKVYSSIRQIVVAPSNSAKNGSSSSGRNKNLDRVEPSIPVFQLNDSIDSLE